MEKKPLLFQKATVPLVSMITKINPADIYHHPFWCKNDFGDCDIYYSESGVLPFAPTTEEADIIPVLVLENLFSSSFNIGDTFTIKGMDFKIFSADTAIALKPIGSFAWCDLDTIGTTVVCDDYSYGRSDIRDIIEDWFDYFISEEAVWKTDILDVYHIEPMPTHHGRYQIVNWDGTVRHNASGYGFTSVEKARNMLKYYAASVPIPEEDLIALDTHRKALIEFSF